MDTQKVTDNLSLLKGFSSARNRIRDWVVLSVAAIIVMLALSVLSVWVFVTIRAGTFAGDGSNVTSGREVVSLDRDKLSSTVTDIQDQRSAFELAKTEQPDIPQPGGE